MDGHVILQAISEIGGGHSCFSDGKRRPCRSLGSATRSVLDFVRTDLRTVRLAIAYGDERQALHPRKSQRSPRQA